jgi:crotonobetainyl-CoA:carnitine CoA-transferase CaiB-like acyl-CoA transferase
MLSGITVLDLTQFLAGPFATQILGDLGADVIKIEWGEGDSTRKLPPYFIDGDSLYYLSTNRNKRSVCLNLKSEEGRDAFLRMVAKADVVIENFRPGVMDRLGLGDEVLRSVNPQIILCSISGYGSDGPLAQLPAYDMIVQAVSGGMSMTGEPGGKPVRTGIPTGDLDAGLYAVIGILAQLYQRARSKDGEKLKHIDVSMLDCQIAKLSYQGAYAMFSGVEPGLQGRGHRSIPTYRAFTCGDGQDVVICANTEEMWRKLCVVLEAEELLQDPAFATNADRLENIDRLMPKLNAGFRKFSASELAKRLNEAGVPAATIHGVLDALRHPQTLHRGMVQELEHQSGTRFRIVGDPLKLSGQSSAPKPPPRLGEHTAQVLREFGYRDEDIERMAKAGAIKFG